jgi:CRISPR-associated endonuclease/helicase Cas3
VNVLLAKSPPKDGGPEKSLKAHTLDVTEAAKAVFGGAFGDQWCTFFRVTDRDAFRLNLQLSAAAHDTGKADEGNQAMLRGDRDARAVRHEHLSAIMLCDTRIREAIAGLGADPAVVIGAVLSHHLKATHRSFMEPVGGVASVCRPILNDDFREVWGLTKLPIPTLPGTIELISEQPLIHNAARLVTEYSRRLSKDPARNRLLTATRAALIAADALGSAVVRLGSGITEWAHGVFGEPLNGEDVRRWVLEGRMKAMGDRWRGLDLFQQEVIRVGPRGLLIAPCGSGKTLAAWNWIADQLDHHPRRWVIFLYPTRATATEGFKDYGANAPPALSTLLHGTSRYELENLFDTPEQGEPYQTQARLFALGLWPKRVVTATVDQFLAFMQYEYGAVCLLPMLADALVVVDEVHCFDPSMLASLKRFLAEHDTPVLCMTATLGGDRRRSLAESGLALYAKDADDQSKVPRYHVRLVSHDQIAPEAAALRARAGKALVVVNRVRVCQNLGTQLGPDALIYHSRFRLMDRQCRHSELVEAFKPTTRSGAVGVATQVAEMSLDLSADLLGTEVASLPPMIQRLGRLAREYPLAPGRIGLALFAEPERSQPYLEEELKRTRLFLAALADRDVSQAEVEEAFLRFALPTTDLDRTTAFYDSGLYANGREESFRDIDEVTRTCILDDDDLDTVLGLIHIGKPWDGFTLPVLRADVDRVGREQWGLPPWVSVVPRRFYHRRYGFMIH